MFDFNASIESVELARDLASFVGYLDGSDWRDVLRESDSGLPQDISAWSTRDSTDQSPRIMRVDCQEGLLYLFQGVKRTATALRLMQAYGESPVQSHPPGLNAQVRRAVADFAPAMFNPSSQDRANILIAGHSYGGACALAFAEDIKFAYPDRNVRCITFGCPKPGTRHYASIAAPISHVRYWNDDDPIRLISPNRSQAPGAHSLLPSRTSSFWSDHAQTGNGIMVMSNGDVYRRSEEFTATPLTELNLIGWASGLMTAPVQAHSIQEYYLRLARTVERGLSIPTDRPGTVYRERRPPGAQVPQPAPTAVPVVVAAVEALAVAAVAERTSPRPTTFRAAQINDQWGVYRGDEMVTLARSGPRARIIARAANEMLRDSRARGVDNEADIARAIAGML